MLRSGTMVRRLAFGLLILCPLSVGVCSTDSLRVDFRYKPAQWNTSIALPDDWQKTLVSETGAVLYDFPGPYSQFKQIKIVNPDGTESDFDGPSVGFKTVLSAGIAGAEMKVSNQRLFDARIPIVLTKSEALGVTLNQEAFAVADSPFQPDSRPTKPRLYRVGRALTNAEWATPPVGSDPAFQNIALGQHQPIHYVYDVEAGGSRTIAVGLIDGEYSDAGKRPLIVEVEGRPAQVIDVAGLAGRNHPLVVLFDGHDLDGDGHITIDIRPVDSAPDTNTVLSALWGFPAGVHPDRAQIISGSLNASADAYISCGENPDIYTYAPRRDVLHLEYSGSKFQPVLRLQTTRAVTFDSATGVVSLNGKAFLVSQPAPLAVQPQNDQTVLVYQNSLSQIDVVMVNGPHMPPSIFHPVNFAQERDRAVAFWKQADLPWNRIQVPDAGIQAVLDSSVRNIFQARDIKDGKPEFRTGPTLYRDIWLVDGSFILETAAELGLVDEVRRAIDRILEFQQPSGQVISLQPDFYKETGIVLWMLERHALLTQDKTWLQTRWTHVQDAVKWIKAIRKTASSDPHAPYAGLIPPGHPDGGIMGPKAEYTNVYWSLAGLKAAVEAAKWLDKPAEAADWEHEYDDFMATFRKAAARDMKTDARGNRYLPILMNPGPEDLPQKGQWGFCHAIFPGKVLSADDPIATGTLAMLDAVNSEGLVLSTGWMTNGIWTYFASFYAHAHLWLGGREHIKKAQQILYAFANHASPLLAWREEQRPVNQGPEMVGDMPHNWASAEFIRLVRNLIALERGDRLVLFEGIPAAWIQPDKDIRLNQIATEFGRLTLRASTSSDGRSISIAIDRIGSPNQPGAPVVDLRVFKQAGFKDASGAPLPDELAGMWGQPLTLTLKK